MTRITYVICERLDSAGEPLFVGLEPSVSVPLMLQPAVVNVDVGVAGVLVPVRHDQVGHLLEQTLTVKRRKEKKRKKTS